MLAESITTDCMPTGAPSGAISLVYHDGRTLNLGWAVGRCKSTASDCRSRRPAQSLKSREVRRFANVVYPNVRSPRKRFSYIKDLICSVCLTGKCESGMEQQSASIDIGGKIRVNAPLTTTKLAQRSARRRPTYIAQAVSYFISAALLALYSYAGTITIAVSIAYLLCGITTTATGLYLSEINFNDRFEDHYLTVPQTIVSMTIQLGAIYLAPEVGFYFIFILFIVLSFGALLMNARETAIVWTYSTIGLTALLLMTDKAIAMPIATWTERALVLACAVTALGRCASTGSIWQFVA